MGRKVIAILITMMGLLLTIYPIILYLEVRQQQALLKEVLAFNSNKNEDEEKSNEPKRNSLQPTLLQIPEISLEVVVVEVEDLSVFEEQSNHPPGHYPGSALPGQKGNVAIAGHRTGPAGYFRNLNKLVPGDEIFLSSGKQKYIYQVEEVFVTYKEDFEVVEPTDYPALTLTSCERVGLVSNAKRLIVRAKLLETVKNYH